MKSIVLSGVVASLLLFTGCSEKTPVVDQKPQVAEKPVKAVEEVKAVETETVASDENVVVAKSSSELMADQQAKYSSIYFDFDKFNIKPSMQDRVSQSAKVTNNSASAYSVKLEGNCDEWGSDEYNFALGLKRANSVKKVLIAEGVESSRISMISYGESNPVCMDKTDACWAKNRRVDFSLLP